MNFISLQAVNEHAEGIQCALAFKTIHALLGNHKIIVEPEVFLKPTKERILDSSITFSLSGHLDSFTQSFTQGAKYRHQISRAIGPLLLSAVQRKYKDMAIYND